ncbi:hypothetical protein ABK905_19795 [Acerihabitans sp. KWT182]|uniref:Uncharacterized protein n=1 Tax=Acerihabitans sp. KWT182 TaxID=3157919 RepID=A0AAU7Q779_9GAMM
MPQAITTALYLTNALVSPHRDKNALDQPGKRAADNINAARDSSPAALAAGSISLPYLDPAENYMMAEDESTDGKYFPIGNFSNHISDPWLHYKVDPQLHAQMLLPQTDAPVDVMRKTISTLSPASLYKINGKKHNRRGEMHPAKIRKPPYQSINPRILRQQSGIIRQCALTLSESEYGSRTKNLNPASYGAGIIYQVYDTQNGQNQPTSRHYIEISNEKIAVRAVVMPGHGVKYEIFDAEHEAVGYPLAFIEGRWIMQQPTAPHVTEFLLARITVEMMDPTLTEAALSAPDARGLQWSRDNKSYLRVKGRYVEVIPNKSKGKNKIYRYHVGSKLKRINLKFHNGQFTVLSQRHVAKKPFNVERREIVIY